MLNRVPTLRMRPRTRGSKGFVIVSPRHLPYGVMEANGLHDSFTGYPVSTRIQLADNVSGNSPTSVCKTRDSPAADPAPKPTC